MINYIGDLSKQDVNVLHKYAQKQKRILEFGVGGSTQIFAQVAKDAQIFSVETSNEWVVKTKSNFNKLNIVDNIIYLNYGDNIPINNFDIIFDDGIDTLRLDFAYRSWKLLKTNGFLLFHDTRREQDMLNVSNFLINFYNEIDNIFINIDDSNITIIQKCLPKKYINWQISENEPPEKYGLT